MLVNINKNRKLELIGDIENNENKDYYIIVKVQPTGQENPADDSGDVVQKVGVINGMAWVLSKDQADKVRYITNE